MTLFMLIFIIYYNKRVLLYKVIMKKLLSIRMWSCIIDDSIKDARSVSLYPYNQSQILQYVKYTK